MKMLVKTVLVLAVAICVASQVVTPPAAVPPQAQPAETPGLSPGQQIARNIANQRALNAIGSAQERITQLQGIAATVQNVANRVEQRLTGNPQPTQQTVQATNEQQPGQQVQNANIQEVNPEANQQQVLNQQIVVEGPGPDSVVEGGPENIQNQVTRLPRGLVQGDLVNRRDIWNVDINGRIVRPNLDDGSVRKPRDVTGNRRSVGIWNVDDRIARPSHLGGGRGVWNENDRERDGRGSDNINRKPRDVADGIWSENDRDGRSDGRNSERDDRRSNDNNKRGPRDVSDNRRNDGIWSENDRDGRSEGRNTERDDRRSNDNNKRGPRDVSDNRQNYRNWSENDRDGRSEGRNTERDDRRSNDNNKRGPRDVSDNRRNDGIWSENDRDGRSEGRNTERDDRRSNDNNKRGPRDVSDNRQNDGIWSENDRDGRLDGRNTERDGRRSNDNNNRGPRDVSDNRRSDGIWNENGKDSRLDDHNTERDSRRSNDNNRGPRDVAENTRWNADDSVVRRVNIGGGRSIGMAMNRDSNSHSRGPRDVANSRSIAGPRGRVVLIQNKNWDGVVDRDGRIGRDERNQRPRLNLDNARRNIDCDREAEVGSEGTPCVNKNRNPRDTRIGDLSELRSLGRSALKGRLDGRGYLRSWDLDGVNHGQARKG